MQRLKFTIALFFLSFYFFSVSGQDSSNAIGHVSIASPTAASLGKYGDIPVSYFTGLPQISIPLYTIKAGPLTLPISLSYHASGLKVMEPASSVGAGWSMNAGGVITRTVMGLPDERGTNAGASELKGHFSDYGYNNYLYAGSQQDWLGFAQGRKDGQPDFFFFNFAGYTGKFFFRDDRTPVIVPQQDLKIVPYYPADSAGYIVIAPGAASIQGFIVTTPDGTQYYFGINPGTTGTAPFEVTDPYTYEWGSGGTAISSWYLEKIVSADGQFTIQLNYQRESYGYYTYSTFPIDGAATGARYEYNLVKNVVKGVRLSKINFPNGTINFLAGAARTDLSDSVATISDGGAHSAATLGAVQITDSSGSCKRFNFFYSYFQDNTTALPGYPGQIGYNLQTDRKRLKLDSLKEISCDSALVVPPYKFSYFSEQVPRRLSFGLDHWGFYNGVTNNSKLIPTYTVNGTPVTGANRDASWPAMRCGALQQINYPTGGYTAFDYEPHDIFGSSTQTVDMPIASVIARMSGQSQYTMVDTFTSNGNNISLTLSRTAGYSAQGSFVITNMSNVTVYGLNIISTTPSTATIPLAAGSYIATLTIPTYDSLHGGAQILLTQQQPVTTYYNATVGGLRIKTITSNDGLTANNMVTSYDYKTSGTQSTGMLYSIPVYVQQTRNDLIENVGYWTVDNGFMPNSLNPFGCPGNGGVYLKSGGSIRPMASVQGSHIGYSQIKVSQTGNGYSVYHYYTSSYGFPTSSGIVAITAVNNQSCNPDAPNYPAAPLPLDFRRGELYYEEHFSNSGNLVRNAFYYPEYDTTTVLSTPGFIVSVGSNGGNSAALFGTIYNLSTVRKTKMLVQEGSYGAPGSGFIQKTTTIYYNSPYHNQPTRQVVSTSLGDSLSTNTKYAFDFRVASCDGTTNCAATYSTTCATCQTQYNTARTACAGNNSCISTAYLNYLQCQANARVSYDSCQRLNYINPTNAFNTCMISAQSSGDTLLKPILRLRNKYINAAIEVSEWKNQNLRRANFTRYDTSLNPVGFAYPGRTKLINLQTPSATFASATVSGSTITKDSRYVDETFYKFGTGNPQQVTPRHGVIGSYIWDYLNNQPIATVTNATSDQIAYTSFEADGGGSWTIGSTLRDTASVTGKKSYNLSNGTISKSGLTAAQYYLVSYWTKNSSAYTITGTISGFPLRGKTIGAWTYFEHKITGQTSVTLTGSGNIDELRLYPANAQMNTYTYQPIVGMTSSCDVNNRVTYYQYDRLLRLRAVYDQDRNIIKTIDYHYLQNPPGVP